MAKWMMAHRRDGSLFWAAAPFPSCDLIMKPVLKRSHLLQPNWRYSDWEYPMPQELSEIFESNHCLVFELIQAFQHWLLMCRHGDWVQLHNENRDALDRGEYTLLQVDPHAIELGAPRPCPCVHITTLVSQLILASLQGCKCLLPSLGQGQPLRLFRRHEETGTIWKGGPCTDMPVWEAIIMGQPSIQTPPLDFPSHDCFLAFSGLLVACGWAGSVSFPRESHCEPGFCRACAAFAGLIQGWALTSSKTYCF